MASVKSVSDIKILYLPLKDEKLPNLKPHKTLKQNEHGSIVEINDNTFDVVTGITKLPYSPTFLQEIYRILKPEAVLMIQIAKETDIKKSLLYSGFNQIDSNQQQQITHVMLNIYINS